MVFREIYRGNWKALGKLGRNGGLGRVSLLLSFLFAVIGTAHGDPMLDEFCGFVAVRG